MNMDLMHLWSQSGYIAKAVIIILFGLSVYSFAVMIEKFRSYKAAKAESLEFLPAFVKCLKDSKVDEAMTVTRRYRKSHIAKVVLPGLLEYEADKREIKDSHDIVGAVGRALERAVALTSAEMKTGLGGLATI